MKFDTPGKKSNNSEDEGDCGLKFGGLKGSPGQSSMQTYEVMSHATSNSVMLDATIERGYTSSRLSRIRSDRKQPVSGKLRFNSEDSQSSGGGMSRGDLADVNLRPIRKVPVEQETTTTRCCCFRLFGGGSNASKTSKKAKKSKKGRDGGVLIDTTKESSRLHDHLMGDASSQNERLLGEENS